MIKGILTIAGWFTSGGAISAFFAWLGVKFTSKAFIVGTQIASVTLLFSARAAYLWAVLEVAKLVINGISLFLSSIPEFMASDELLAIGLKVLQSIGIIDALIDAFSLFNTLFVAILSAWVLRFAFHTAKVSSDEFFKIGMLLQA